MRKFSRYFVLATVGAAVLFLACAAVAQYSAPKSDLPGEYQEPAPLPPGSITLEELDRRRSGTAPATGAAPAPTPAAPAPAPAPAAPAPAPTYGAPAPAPEPAITYGEPGAAPAPAAPPPTYGAPAPAPRYGAPQISTLPMATSPQAQPPAPSAGAYGAAPAAPSGARSDLPPDYVAPSEPLPPGSITLEAYDAKVKGGAAAAPAAAPAGAPAPAPATPPPTLEETTEEITGDAFGADEEEAVPPPTRWDNY